MFMFPFLSLSLSFHLPSPQSGKIIRFSFFHYFLLNFLLIILLLFVISSISGWNIFLISFFFLSSTYLSFKWKYFCYCSSLPASLEVLEVIKESEKSSQLSPCLVHGKVRLFQVNAASQYLHELAQLIGKDQVSSSFCFISFRDLRFLGKWLSRLHTHTHKVTHSLSPRFFWNILGKSRRKFS